MISLFNSRISCILYEVVQMLFCSCAVMDCSALGKQGKPHLVANILAKMFVARVLALFAHFKVFASLQLLCYLVQIFTTSLTT